jgi:poly(A) polymerase
VRELGEWWTRAQTVAHDELAAELSSEATPKPAASADAPAPAKRRRRRRKPAQAPAGSE